MLLLKLSLLRSTLHRVRLAPCLPTAKPLSRAGVPRGKPCSARGGQALRAGCAAWPGNGHALRARVRVQVREWTCPPHGQAAENSPNMPAPWAREWTCPQGPRRRDGHAPRGGARVQIQEWTCPRSGLLVQIQEWTCPRSGLRVHAREWTCPPCGRTAEHSPNMPTPRARDWACPARAPTRGPPTPGDQSPVKTIRRSAPPRSRPSFDGGWPDVGGPAPGSGRGNRSRKGFSCSSILSHI